MSFNQFMHPRNIYRQKIDYEQLANEFEEFRKCLSYDSNGKCFIDYDNVETLKLLTKTLLQKDFNLNVQIPNDRLVPTLPMRLNYILWIEDLLNHLNISYSSTSISAIDIGTGSCAIFPLLSVVMNPNWKFIATEIDSVNLKFAQDNVRNNNLMNKIQIYDNGHTDTLFKHLLQTHDLHFTFIMSNPPFFDDTFNDSFENIDLNDHSQNDTKATKTKKYFHNKKLQTTSPNEAINENGGELSFIMKIIQESFETKNLIDLYTVMIGRKKTFLQLKSFLKENVEQHKLISSYSYTELCQGYTKRWALAWTFNNGYDLKNSPRIKQIKSKPLIYYLDDNSRKLLPEYTLKSVGNFIENLLINDLNIEQFTKIELNKRIEFDIKSNVASWKNQRRKRRQEKQHSFEDGDSFSNGKRLLNDDNSTDQQHHQSTANCLKNRKVTHTNEKCKMNLTYLLHCSLIIKRDKQDIYIKMETKQMSQNKSSTYELLQYFKNKLTINHSD